MEWNPNYEKSLDRSKYTTLNQNQLKFASDFFPTSNNTFTSLDPRMTDVMRGERMTLNEPVFDSTFYDKERRENIIHAQTYSSYNDITSGEIFYYTDDYFEQPYFSPIFQLRSQIHPNIFQDPMGSLKPQYNRYTIPTSKYISEYSFDQDQMSFREDIMSRQMRKMNESKYTLFNHSKDNMLLTKNPFC